ncbi:MAG: DUF4364 family protein [Lachnospiraceae bacterium]|nr:DUF4364 family protein [Lachnospiraceae bacterium]MBO6089387.1 DUF4364 family protein [Lachnospiraceae bacterium]SDJ05164.1 protein of unknown function [Lachnospiraceae bacterium G41]
MNYNSDTLYKLMILYMLKSAAEPLTLIQISTFFVEKEYTDFLKIQGHVKALEDQNFLAVKENHNKTLISITEEGMESLQYFLGDISSEIKCDIQEYLKVNSTELRREASIVSDYYKNQYGEYEAILWAKDRDTELCTIKMTVPSEKMAAAICDNWQEKNQEIYQFLTENLF